MFLPPGMRRTCDRPDGDAVPEQLEVLCGHLAGDGGQALVPGYVGGVDQAPQRPGDLAGPDRVRVGLGGVLKVTQQVGIMKNSS